MKKELSIIIFTLLVLSTNSLTCGNNCPSNTCSDCWCGETNNYINITEECSKYDWDQRCCQCIISKESGGNSNAMFKVTEKNSKTGVWQLDDTIKITTCRLKYEDRTSLCDKNINIACAYNLYQLNKLLGYWNP